MPGLDEDETRTRCLTESPEADLSSLRILIADDHEIVRRGLKPVLSSRPDWIVFAEAGTGRCAGGSASTRYRHIMRKLEVHGVSELARYAVKNKVIEP
jgi:DNA-binding NarL/FixJ family response regulator